MSSRQQRFTRFFNLYGVTLVCAVFIICARSASAFQLYIDQMYVHQVNKNCIQQVDSSGNLYFYCPPINCQTCCDIPGAVPGNPSTVPPSCQSCMGSVGGQLICNDPTVNGVLYTPADFIGPASQDPNGNSNAILNVTINSSGTVTSSYTFSGNELGFGNISNDPEMQFAQPSYADQCATTYGSTEPGSGPFSVGVSSTNICNNEVFVCASIGYNNSDSGPQSTPVGIDQLEFEIFKYQNGSNPLDPTSTPPVRTYFINAPGTIPGGGCNSNEIGSVSFSTGTGNGSGETTTYSPNAACTGPLGPYCVIWDGSINIQGGLGRSDGQYGVRATVTTNQVGTQGNIQVSAQSAYPQGSTYDANSAVPGDKDNVVSQQPIVVDANDVHAVQSTPTIVGKITGVAAEPYNITYRLSQDASFYLSITEPPSATVIRDIVPGLARPGEGIPNGSLTDGDAWDGRNNSGQMMPPGNYLATLQSNSVDQYGQDLSYATTAQISLDPLQITDIQVQPLLGGSTSLAVLTYTLTEPATVYVDVYPPGTTFCSTLNDVNSVSLDSQPAVGGIGTPKDFEPSSDGCNGGNAVNLVAPIKHFVTQQISRTPVVTFWDGLNNSEQVMPDGDYVFVMYADLPSQEGFPFCQSGACTSGNPGDDRIWTSVAKTGFIPISRGYVGVSQITPITTVVGSSPPVAGIDPFTFDYSLSREANVNFEILNSSGQVVKTLVNNEVRPGNTGISETWSDGVGDNGQVVSSGVYVAQLAVSDPFVPAQVTTTTVMFPVDLFRITDVQVQPLLVGTTGDVASIGYQLSNNMNVAWNIYPPGTIFKNQSTDWPPCGQLVGGSCADVVGPGGAEISPIISIYGFRAGRFHVTENWNGRDINGLTVPDGDYVYDFVAQSTSTPAMYATDKIEGTVAVQRGYVGFPTFAVNPTIPQLFNSSAAATVQLPPYTIDYSLTRVSSVTIQILNTSAPFNVVRTVISGQERDGGIPISDVWDGLDNNGHYLAPGFYTVQVLAQDIASENSQLSLSTAEATIAYQPLQVYDEAATIMDASHPSGTIYYQVSQPMKVAIKIYKPGTTFDPYGNPTPPASISLVKLIVGVEPARTQVQTVWDGTDLDYSKVQDGNYEFTISASTDMNAIDDITGNVLVPSALANDYQSFGEIPVTRGASADPQGDFNGNTFVYPNPVPSSYPTATFQIYFPVQAVAHLRIYNIAGELVYTHDFPNTAPSYNAGPVTFVWNKDNQSGRTVARGIYYAVIREEETLGGANVYQTVKKILLQ